MDDQGKRMHECMKDSIPLVEDLMKALETEGEFKLTDREQAIYGHIMMTVITLMGEMSHQYSGDSNA